VTNEGAAFEVIEWPATDGWLDLTAATWADYDPDGGGDILLAGTYNSGEQIDGRAPPAPRARQRERRDELRAGRVDLAGRRRVHVDRARGGQRLQREHPRRRHLHRRRVAPVHLMRLSADPFTATYRLLLVQ
jgi:hypothetical protein